MADTVKTRRLRTYITYIRERKQGEGNINSSSSNAKRTPSVRPFYPVDDLVRFDYS